MSLTMQAFRARLDAADAIRDTYAAILAQLTRLSRAQMNALRSELEWQPW